MQVNLPRCLTYRVFYIIYEFKNGYVQQYISTEHHLQRLYKELDNISLGLGA